jgi:hypothetical protein
VEAEDGRRTGKGKVEEGKKKSLRIIVFTKNGTGFFFGIDLKR